MQFMIVFHHIAGVWEGLTQEQQADHARSFDRFTADLESEKNAQLVFFSPVEQRRTVRKHKDGSVDVTDGPAIPSSEQPGGYFIVEAESLDEAVEWARRGRWLEGSNEVRQIVSLPG